MPLVRYDPKLAALPGVVAVGSRLLVPFGTGRTERAALPRPSLPRKAKNLARALVDVARGAINGGPVFASVETETARRATCWACDLWEPDGNLGFGECTHPGCGCTRAKLKLASAKCPLGKWPS